MSLWSGDATPRVSGAPPALVLHEDDDLLVVNKPAGWNTHAPAPHAGEGVYDWLRQREPRWSGLSILHRLDKETSGVLVFGKTTRANQSLAAQFEGRGIRKVYVLRTDRPGPTAARVAVSSIERAGERYVSRPLRPGADRAETRFGPGAEDGAGHRRVEAEPVTGRTHQIRVHAAELGFPILGDVTYGGTPWARVCLHAAALTLEHPATGQPITFRAPVDFDRDPREALRLAVVDPAETDAWRVVHGAADGWPGWYVDRLGTRLLSQSEAPLTAAQREFLEARRGAGSVHHKTLDRQVRRSNPEEASPRLMAGAAAADPFCIRENGVTFELSFAEGYSVGLFLDQRDNRRRLLVNHVGQGFPLFPEGASGREVLNTFAYTCGFSVCAARAGARVTSLDLSRKYLDWGRRNFLLNGLDPAAHDFIYGDTFQWLGRLARKGRRFDLVLLDPPTFSQSRDSGVFRAEKDYGKLVTAALGVLAPSGVLFASTNAAGLEPAEFLSMVDGAIARGGRRVATRCYVPQPPDFPITRDEPAYLKTVWLRVV